MESFNCDKCEGTIDNLLQCESCNLWFCGTCSKIPEEALSIIGEINNINWLCQSCEPGVLDFIKKGHNSNVASTPGDILPAVTSTITAAISSLQEALQGTITTLVNSTLRLQMQDNQMEISATDPSRDIPSTDISGHRVVDIVDEYVERERCKCNLLIHNFPENISPDNDHSCANDIKNFSNLVNREFNINDPKIVKAVRLRQTNPEKPRLLLITLKDISFKRSILKQATKLRNSSKWNKVFISPDLTPKQRQTNKKLREELRN